MHCFALAARLAALFALAFQSPASAQTPDGMGAALAKAENASLPTGWERTFGGAEWDQLTAIAHLRDGGFLAAGYTESLGTGTYRSWLLRLDAAGAVQWDRTVGGAAWVELSAIAPLPDGGVLVAGSTESQGAGISDGWLLRLDAGGTVLWEQTFDGAERDALSALAPLPDGGIFAAGGTRNEGAAGGDGWLLRLDAGGTVLWERTLGGAEGDVLSALAPLPDGGVLAAGLTVSRRAGDADGWLLRLDATGTLLWERTFGGAEKDGLTALALLPDGGVVAAGWTESQGAGHQDGWLLRLDATGTVQWERTFGGAAIDGLSTLASLPDGGVLVAGLTVRRRAGDADGWLLRLDATGALLWERTFGGAEKDGLTALALLPDGGVVAAGWTESQGAGHQDGWLLRLTAEEIAP